jgi:hypothetical protein
MKSTLLESATAAMKARSLATAPSARASSAPSA